MAQTTQWSPAILDYMKNVRLTYQRPTTTHPVLTRLLRFCRVNIYTTSDFAKSSINFISRLRVFVLLFIV